MGINAENLVELTMLEVAAVTGGGDPLNNPPGIAMNMAMMENDPEPENDPRK